MGENRVKGWWIWFSRFRAFPYRALMGCMLRTLEWLNSDGHGEMANIDHILDRDLELRKT